MFPPDAIKTWDMEVEYRHWCQVAELKGCPAEQFAFRWEQMRKIYAMATDTRLPMEQACEAFLVQARAELGEDVARLVFGWTWARILSRAE
ncbi:hypothetical protein SAMN05428989_1834 [Pseudoxanthomonas sp. GM95]|uniref:hypothetical protein n=1 Tax=Pseudoxanthomonas sp. GM95 TaxID=1881043 RepID=UPI0008B233E9|nr:hypothetical protein [Pseudoxanthomonas sp. GM95]SEL52034.1 hypothetical protein SAMN05428989_1834 [Pseudoxanthomonas sp. GM95]